MPVFRRKERTVIPVICGYGELSGDLAKELNRQANRDPFYGGYVFRSFGVEGLKRRGASDRRYRQVSKAPLALTVYETFDDTLRGILGREGHDVPILHALEPEDPQDELDRVAPGILREVKDFLSHARR